MPGGMRSRRGAIVVMVGVMFMAIMAISAIAIDFSRLWSVRNELETSADAAALAGAIQFIGTRVKAKADSFARAYAAQNLVMAGVDSVEQVVIGKWDDNTATFTPGAPDSTAIHVVVSRQSSGLIMNAFGVPSPRMRASAIAWADAPVATTACIKPWAVPYVTLMYRINLYRNAHDPTPLFVPPNSWANMTRAFDQTNDIAALNSMTVAERTFDLKLGSGGGFKDSVSQAMPGDYQAVELPKLWDAATQSYPTPGPVPGGQAYQDNVAGNTCYGLSVGDSLTTEPGDKVGPTVSGVVGGPCPTLLGSKKNDPYNTPQSSTAFGNCLDANGLPPDIKAAFYFCPSGCNGKSTVSVNMLGSFTLLKVFPENSKPKGAYTQFDEAEIVGVFNPIQDSGPVGGTSTTLQRPILVR
jgi:Flp pilus assembly protein TadG